MAYIHDHCLGYRHNYLIFYQLPNSNLFTHRMLFFLREATSEIYGPRVSSLLYLPSRSILFAFIFRYIFPKTLKYLAAVYFILHLFTVYLSNLSYFYPVNWTISGTVTRKGLTTCHGFVTADVLVKGLSHGGIATG